MRSKLAREMPAVALTAYVTKEDREGAITAGFQLHISKPVEPSALVMSIASVTGRKV